METKPLTSTIKLLPVQKRLVDKILQLIKDDPELHDFCYDIGTGKTTALKALEAELHSFRKTVNPKG